MKFKMKEVSPAILAVSVWIAVHILYNGWFIVPYLAAALTLMLISILALPRLLLKLI